MKQPYIGVIPGHIKDGDDTRTNLLAVLGMESLEPMSIGDYNDGYHTPPVAAVEIDGKQYSLKSILSAVGNVVKDGVQYKGTLPATGKTGAVYVTDNGLYKWNGSKYVPIQAELPSYDYGGVNLLSSMTAAQLHSKVAAGDFTGIRNGDYVEVVLNGSFWDYGTYTCPSGTTCYSDTGLATSAGTTSSALEATYVNDTYCEITVSGTKYYVATSACDDHFVRTLNNAVMKFEANIDFYYKYGDSGLSGGAHHIAFVSRDLLPVLLKMRKANSAWTNTETDNPWLGSALYKTFNDPDHGILALMAATSIGPYIYAGPNGKGMRFLGEKKAAGAGTATDRTWYDRGKLWVPSEREVWGANVFSEHTNGAGLALQMPIFAGSLRHIVKGLGNNGSRYNWWCLSSYAGYSAYFCSVSSSGLPNADSAANAWVGAPVGFLLT